MTAGPPPRRPGGSAIALSGGQRLGRAFMHEEIASPGCFDLNFRRDPVPLTTANYTCGMCIVIVVTATRSIRRYSGAVYDLGLHVMWCSKYRRRVLGGSVATRLHELIEQKAAEKGWEIATLEIAPDHVRVFVRHDPKASASYVANQFKGFTSRVLRSEFPHLKSRMPTLWSSSFFVASAGTLSADAMEKYIDTQWERPGSKKQGGDNS
ncbi:IS200/IS605 family transposase [Streptomyces albidoflavus]|nr:MULTISPECIES: IS200/IS605 family transposase [Streptomyces]MCL6277095.1 IS200/IS605 family transposase [Streptomyces albidoflavus]MCX4443732.1 IS200/IS605 family transposase [Streptomyces albidoflavus]MCX4467579.1 IS200/IS605 family transposase [Streptomyces albidoflavus]MEE1724949.1 IS200/IS605 family transposase [Streptomyces sp. JV186]WAD00146.1 IS200/IS605 family transposase [Streptomyces sp. NA13]